MSKLVQDLVVNNNNFTIEKEKLQIAKDLLQKELEQLKDLKPDISTTDDITRRGERIKELSKTNMDSTLDLERRIKDLSQLMTKRK